jgi:magnesium-transporting ATPase (P-type)
VGWQPHIDEKDAMKQVDSVQDEPISTWHALTTQDTLDKTQASRARGLTLAEVSDRQARFGPNALPVGRKRGPLLRFLAQFNNVLVWVLLIAAGVTLLLDHAIDSAVILGVVLINAVIGLVQEGKAESALEKIREMLSPFALVLRDGVRREIPAQELVVGDIVFIAAGDKVPADLRLLEVYSLSIEEAALTGESLAVEKSVDAVAADAALGDRVCMAYSGTIITAGQGCGLVVGIGMGTEIGRISQILEAVQELNTPLTRKMNGFGKWLSLAILIFASLAFAFGYWVQGYAMSEMFLAAVGIAVAAIPEGLPAIMTISLAIGVQRMAKRRAIIRKLPVVEALGSVTVICSDKTGTLTRNEMMVQRVITAELDAIVGGTGYSPHGDFRQEGHKQSSTDGNRKPVADDDENQRPATAGEGHPLAPADYPVLQQLGRVAGLCNDAQITHENNEWLLAGDPTEGALASLSMKMGLESARLNEIYPRLDVVPFDSDYQFMATLHPTPAGEQIVLLKGAPEKVLALCDAVQLDVDTRPLNPDHWRERMDDMAARGMRVLAIAERKRASEHGERLTLAEIQRGGFLLLGLVGMTDPPREEVIAAIGRCHTAGITVKMITGDHVRTAQAIGEQIGIGAPPAAVLSSERAGSAVSAAPLRALSGQEIDRLSHEELMQVVREAHVFARATPEHKLRLVEALQAQGHVVAMTGDGVNDAPALKRADVGVAMGRKGTEAAKEAAEMVLADDNFASIAAAVEEGRTVYDNIRKAIVFILPTNGGEAGMLIVAILLGLTMPITPVQILWVNMVTAITLALAIAFEDAERNIMRRPPRPPNESLIQPFLLWRIALVSGLLVAGCLGLFLWEMDRGESLEAARTAAVNALVVGEMAYLFNSRHLTSSVLSREGILGNRMVLLACAVLVVLQLLMTYLPVMQTLFGTAALGWDSWWRILVFGLGLFFIIEFEKKMVSRRHRLQVSPAHDAR